MKPSPGVLDSLLLCLFLCVSLVNGALDEPTAAENEALVKFRPMVVDILYRDFMQTDSYLLRWLRHFNLDVNRATNAVRVAHKWRQDNKIDSILDEDFRAFEKAYPFDMSSVDKNGRPVWLQLYGRWDVRKAALAGEIVQYNRYLNYLYEKISTRVRELDEQNPGRNITQFVLIIDMKGYNLRQHGCLACVPGNTHFILAYERYYAGSAYRTILVNTPPIFENLFEILKPLMSESTKKGLKVLGLSQNQWTKDVYELVERDQLPARFGGTKKLSRIFD